VSMGMLFSHLPNFSGLQAKISSGGFIKSTLFNLAYKL
jgi:hypothetical protein